MKDDKIIIVKQHKQELGKAIYTLTNSLLKANQDLKELRIKAKQLVESINKLKSDE